MMGPNFLAVLVGAIIFMVLGALWYGPLFAKPWIAAMGKTMAEIQAEGGVAKAYALTFVGALITTLVMAMAIGGSGQMDLVGGAVAGALLWLGFVATSSLGSVVFEGRPVALYAITNGYHLVAYAIVGALLAAWR